MALLTCLLSTPSRANAAHPLHTSLTVLTHAPDGRVTASIRVFASDLAELLGREKSDTASAPSAQASARLAAYLSGRFVLANRDGRRIPLTWCGAKRTGDLLWLCVSGQGIASLSGATLTNSILLERFADQVNIVQAQYGGRRQSMLFTRAEAPKRLP